MKTKHFTIPTACLVIVAGLVVLRFWGAQIEHVGLYVEFMAPGLISDDSWRSSIEADPTSHEYSAYGVLQDRDSDAAIAEGLRDLESSDPYAWVNAAHYLGSRGRTEAIPYLIKGLRHTAYRSDDERAKLLRQLTGQHFGPVFSDWYEWYVKEDGAKKIYWRSCLGYKPRLGANTSP